MLISELAKQVHDNAVAHGWWENQRQAPEIIALIHSEWSEALEEARADRPLVWYACTASSEPDTPCMKDGCGDYYDGACAINHIGEKPEGVAVELIDGCIRILDYFGELEVEINDIDNNADSDIEGLYLDDMIGGELLPAAHLVTFLHMFTSDAISDAGGLIGDVDPMKLLSAMALALSWVKKQGLDPLTILLEKHEYNKTRPYKHGKKF